MTEMNLPASLRPAAPRRSLIVAAVMTLALIASSFPYQYGASIAPPDTRFWAVPPHHWTDANQYLAWTRMTADGAVLLGDPFTSEPHAPRLFLPHVLVQGWIARLADGDTLVAFHAMRVLTGALLLAIAWWFGLLLLPRWRLRRLYLGFLCFSAGASWLLERIGITSPSGDHYQPEANTFFSLATLPHLPLAAALLTGIFATLLALERAGDRAARLRWLALTLLLAALVSWIHPFDFMALALGLGTYGLVRLWRDRRLPGASIAHAVAVFVGALPAAVYLVTVTLADPFYRALAGDILEVQPWTYYAIAHVLLMLPAVVVLARPELRRRYTLPLCWVLTVFLVLAVPLQLGGKLARVVGGVHVPLALLAAVGTDYAARWIAARRPGRAAITRRRRRFLAATLSTGWFALTVTGVYGMVERHIDAYADPAFFLPASLNAVLYVLDRDGGGEITLGGHYTGTLAPALADTRSFQGHWHLTLDSPRKLAVAHQFYMGALSYERSTGHADPAERARMLRQLGITWVIWYPTEWTVAGRVYAVPLDDVPGLRPVLTMPKATLYRFQP